jgi:mRNA (2'-O-methyladenosine-N6-)-methyltransferase
MQWRVVTNCLAAALHPILPVAGTRKLEIFARQHNIKPGWIGLGNQLNGTHLLEQDLLQRYIERHGPPELPSPNFKPPK